LGQPIGGQRKEVRGVLVGAGDKRGKGMVKGGIGAEKKKT